ncbi:pyrroline-5-carboxylate reductase [Legionella lansingensis]|uniref:Pyrroline-5-carboxylate reductase n=1 Tax=Legionella lansingensis TaxID=45067 RepID=A0A0W0VKG2_9GAMM|nr:Rossmann-like and DUF2520 domain-containing protein [Legionella lansingensis]KTD20596.1 pyrroline-5-carboxylate reductase [Legionella lansingensis]SNV46299.1 pyrroline-5-carboxylate reductase [Legionella lansingensis]
MSLLVNIIGAGHLGKTIGYLLAKSRGIKIGAICNQSLESSKAAIQFIGSGNYCTSINKLPPADITLITTPDDMISHVCEELSKNAFIKKNSVVLHCSGSLTSDALSTIKDKGCYVASIHPMKSFANPELCVEQYNGTYCAVEGDKMAISTITPLFNSIGSITYAIDKTKKSLYHAAGVFASNYLVTLAEQALICLKDAGVENELAMHIITNIMRGTISNLEKTLSPAQSLTGPIQRGDISTLKKHMESFSAIEQKKLYSSLGKATLPLTSHGKNKKERIETVLQA